MLDHVTTAIQTEAIACCEALRAAAAWGMGCVILETDCANLKHALQTKEFDLSPEGVIFRDIRSFIQMNFISCEVVYCPRDCNKVADALAAFGASQSVYRLGWLESVPDFVNVLLASELSEPL